MESEVKVILYITVLLSKVLRAALNRQAVRLKRHYLYGLPRKEKFSRYSSPVCLEHLYPMIFLLGLKHCLVFSLSILRPKELVFCAMDRKQDLVSLCISTKMFRLDGYQISLPMVLRSGWNYKIVSISLTLDIIFQKNNWGARLFTVSFVSPRPSMFASGEHWGRGGTKVTVSRGASH